MNTESAFTAVRQSLLQAKLCREAWWELAGHHEDRELAVTLHRRYYWAWETLCVATFRTYILSLASLFDKIDDKYSLRDIPGIKDDAEYDDLWSKGRRINNYRSKVIAHTDKRIEEDKYEKELGFTHNEIEKILNDACRLFNKYADLANEAPVPYASCKSDLKHIIRSLTKH